MQDDRRRRPLASSEDVVDIRLVGTGSLLSLELDESADGGDWRRVASLTDQLLREFPTLPCRAQLTFSTGPDGRTAGSLKLVPRIR